MKKFSTLFFSVLSLLRFSYATLRVGYESIPRVVLEFSREENGLLKLERQITCDEIETASISFWNLEQVIFVYSQLFLLYDFTDFSKIWLQTIDDVGLVYNVQMTSHRSMFKSFQFQLDENISRSNNFDALAESLERINGIIGEYSKIRSEYDCVTLKKSFIKKLRIVLQNSKLKERVCNKNMSLSPSFDYIFNISIFNTFHNLLVIFIETVATQIVEIFENADPAIVGDLNPKYKTPEYHKKELSQEVLKDQDSKKRFLLRIGLRGFDYIVNFYSSYYFNKLIS